MEIHRRTKNLLGELIDLIVRDQMNSHKRINNRQLGAVSRSAIVNHPNTDSCTHTVCPVKAKSCLSEKKRRRKMLLWRDRMRLLRMLTC